MTTHHLSVDRSRRVTDQAGPCHTRWHPDIPPVLTCAPGDDILLETRDASHGQYSMASTHDDITRVDRSIVHPLTGPIRVVGAEPGDVLVVEVLDIVPGAFGYTGLIPGFGFLRDEFPEPFLVRWAIEGDWAVSEDLPGVRIPGAPFMGILGVAPSPHLLAAVTERERSQAELGALVYLPDPMGAVPDDEFVGREGLRTMPPREFGGNLDVKALVAGTRTSLPVFVPGALFSAGDGHFAQGDGEVCGCAIETATQLHVRLDLSPGDPGEPGRPAIRYEGTTGSADRPYVATTGMCVGSSASEAENLTLAARNAVKNMIDLIVDEFGYTRPQACAICSVTVDLRVSEVVDVPNFVVSAVLPLDVFSV